MRVARPGLALPISVTLLVVTAFFALFVGDYVLDAPTVLRILTSPLTGAQVDVPDSAWTAVLQVRLPRVMAAVLVGGALALSGATYQGVFRNPLVSPDLLGVSAGACVGAAAAILAHAGGLVVAAAALVGGLAAVAATVGLARAFRSGSVLALLLSGIIVSGFAASALGLLKYVADPETELASIVYWQLGSLAGVTPTQLRLLAGPILVCAAAIIVLRWRVLILSLGDRTATLLGTDVRRLRAFMILCSTVLTACAVCIAGTVGWIGLVIPHLCRFLLRGDSAAVLPLSAVIGALFLLGVDTLGRTIALTEIPLSILIGFVGVPLFIWLVLRRRSVLG